MRTQIFIHRNESGTWVSKIIIDGRVHKYLYTLTRWGAKRVSFRHVRQEHLRRGLKESTGHIHIF